MSLLTPATSTPAPKSPAVLAAIQAQDDRAAAQSLLAHPAQAFAQRLKAAEENFALVWGNPNPANILTLLSTSAGELFRLAGLELAYLESLQPGCTAAIQATIRPTTSHEDGTVTLE